MIGQVLKYCIPFPIDVTNISEIEMPEGIRVCDVHHQGDYLYVWALTEVDAPLKTYRFVVYGTGWKIDNTEYLNFLKTVHMPNGLVWHVFWIKDL